MKCQIKVKNIAFGNKEHITDRKWESLAELHFQIYHNGPSDPKGNENIICTIVKYGKLIFLEK